MPRVASPSRLSVGSPLTRNRQPAAASFARRAPSLPRSSPTTNSRPTRVSPARRSRSAAAPARRECPSRRTSRGRRSDRPRRGSGKTAARSRSAWRTRPPAAAASGTVARTLKRDVVDRLLGDGEAERAQVVRQPAARLALAAGRRVDVDQRARQRDEIDAGGHRIHASSSVRVSVRESRYFTMTGVASDRPHSGPFPPVTARAPGTTTAPSGIDERPIGRRPDDLAVHQVVDRRRSGQHRAGGDHRARLDDRAFVDAGVAADERLVFDDHRQRADRLDHAADLRGGADVHARADLRARPDERVRVDERLLADVRADVHVHRRHADDAGREVRAVADRRAAGHDAHAGAEARAASAAACPCRRTAAAVIHRRVDEVAEPEAEQNALLDPGVDAPAARARRHRARRRGPCRPTAPRAAARTPAAPSAWSPTRRRRPGLRCRARACLVHHRRLEQVERPAGP